MKKMFKAFGALATTALVLSACGASDSSKESTSGMMEKTSGMTEGMAKENLKVGLVSDSGGIHDKSFNQGTYEGIQAWLKDNAGSTEVPPIETKNTSDLAANLTNMANNSDVVFASGFLFQDPLSTVAPQVLQSHPDVKFILIDAEVQSTNVANYLFAEQEAGYLAGIAAASQSKSGKVGFIGGQALPAVQKFGWGFIAGAQSVNPNIEIFYEYSGSFTDVAKGKTLAATMYDQGADVIFAAAGATGTGAINEAKERVKDGDDIKNWVIGVDRDQYADGLLNKDDANGKSVVLTSAVKRVDQAAKTALTSIKEGKFEGGKTTILTAKEDGVGIPEDNKNLSADILTKVKAALQEIKDGKVTAPSSQEEIDNFVKEKSIKITGKY